MSQMTSAGRVKHFDLNTLGRDFAVGDIHGCYSELQSALNAVNFNEQTDRLFSVGDLVDRGYESELCLEWLAKPWFHAIRGNHEEMFLHFYQKNMSAEHMVDVGGEWAVSLSDDELNIYADAFERLPVALDGVVSGNGKYSTLRFFNCAQWPKFSTTYLGFASP